MAAEPSTIRTTSAHGHHVRSSAAFSGAIPDYTEIPVAFEGRSRTLFRILPLVVAVVPPALIVLAIRRAGAEIPIESHWDMLPIVERFVAGTLGFGDLWAQQNEHRCVLPWLAMLGLAHFTGWDMRAELYLNVVFSAAAVGVLAALIHRTTRPAGGALAPWLVLATSLLTFSLVKWENWLWGLSQAAFLVTVAACLTVGVLAWRGPTPSGAALALLAAASGVLSFASGLVLLGIVPLGLLLDPRAPLRIRVRLAAATLVGGAALAVVYVVGLRFPAKHPNPWLFLERPAAFAGYVLAYLGAPLGWPDLSRSIVWGAVGVTVLAVAATWLWVRVRDARADVLPWILLAAWVLGSAAIVGVGRLGFGLGQALSSRYTTISSFFWVSVAVVVGVLVATLVERRAAAARTTLAVVVGAVVLVIAAAASYTSVWLRSEHWVDSLERAHRWTLECVRFHREAPDACLVIAHPDVKLARRGAARLEALGVGPFRHRAPRPPLASYTLVETREPAGAIASAWIAPIVIPFVLGTEPRTYESVEIVLAGWARNPETQQAPAAVLVVAGGTVLDRVVVDDARRQGEERPPWTYRFNAFRLPKDATVIEAFAVLDGGRIARLAGARPIERVGPSP